jgi:hypothetical protein
VGLFARRRADTLIVSGDEGVKIFNCGPSANPRPA